MKLKKLFGQKDENRKKITAGNNPASICIYTDSNRTLTIVPFYYYEDTPMSVDVGAYKLIDPPYTTEEIGIEILSCYEQARHKSPVTKEQRDKAVPSFKRITGKDFLYWIRRHECIEVCFKEQISIQFMHREISGSNRGYSLHMEEQNETEITLSSGALAKDIGTAVDAVYFKKMDVHLAGQ